MTALDPAAELLAALVEMKRDADAAFEEMARGRAAADARLLEAAREGAAAAHSPKAPSTCTHAPAACATRQTSPTGSNAPVLTLPACAQTIVGPAMRGSCSARRRP